MTHHDIIDTVVEHCADTRLGLAIIRLFEAGETITDDARRNACRGAVELLDPYLRTEAAAPTPAPVAASKPAKPATNGKRGGNMGSKRCSKCGESKGLTAFASGAETCRKCAGTSTGRPPKKPITRTKGATFVPHTPPRPNGKRVCMVCDTPKGTDKFDGEARVCRVCESEGLTSGEIE